MILVGSMVPNFKQILFHFQILVYQKQFLLFPKIFGKSWDSKAKYRKTGFGPFFKPCYGLKLKRTFLKKVKIISTVIV